MRFGALGNVEMEVRIVPPGSDKTAARLRLVARQQRVESGMIRPLAERCAQGGGLKIVTPVLFAAFDRAGPELHQMVDEARTAVSCESGILLPLTVSSTVPFA